MNRLILRRLLLLPVVLVGNTLLIFCLLQFVSPLERVSLYVSSIPHNADAMQGLIKRYGLDKPLPVQYWQWLVGRADPVSGEWVGGVLRGELGYSRSAAQTVAQLIRQRLPATLELTLYAFIPTVFVGVWLGTLAALRRNSAIDNLLRVLTLFGVALPPFLCSLLLLTLFYARLGWFPPGRLSPWANHVVTAPGFHSITTLITLDALLNGRFDILLDALRHLILPVITLAYTLLAFYVRVTRVAMIETLRQSYTTTAHAKGLPRRTVIYRHALRNALLPITTLSGTGIIGLLASMIFVETVFAYPGIGAAAASAAASFDVITTLAFTLLASMIVVVSNLAADLLYTLLDPRVRL